MSLQLKRYVIISFVIMSELGSNFSPFLLSNITYFFLKWTCTITLFLSPPPPINKWGTFMILKSKREEHYNLKNLELKQITGIKINFFDCSQILSIGIIFFSHKIKLSLVFFHLIVIISYKKLIFCSKYCKHLYLLISSVMATYTDIMNT